MDYPGKVITKNQVTPTQTSATGVWTLDDAAAATRNNNWPVAGVPNPISKSLRFNSADSAYLNRTPSVAGNLRTWTWSGWVKRSALGGAVVRLFNANDSGSPFLQTSLRFDTDQLRFYNDANSTADVKSSAVYRDASAWYHIVCAIDTTQATSSNRVKLYVNGSQVTALATATYPNQNTDMYVNAARAHQIGSSVTPSQFFDGYLTEINFIDGQALTPSSFGMTNPQTGQWIPIKYSGTYGTNGFYLNFKDATSTTTLGLDYSGNANNWTTNNFSVTAGAGNDSLTDVPTPWFAYNTTGDVGGVFRGNYATLNPLSNLGSTFTFTNGNLDCLLSAGDKAVPSTMLVSSGKWYCEMTITAVGSGGSSVGLIPTIYAASAQIGNSTDSYAYRSSGNKRTNSTDSAYGASYTTNDVIGIALDLDAGTLVFYKNGTTQGTAFSSISGAFAFAFSSTSSGSTTSVTANFGQRPFAYTPPSGFLSLCTTNLPSSTVLKGSDYFNANLYTGNGFPTTGTQSITGLDFQPDFLWIKDRSRSGYNHFLQDVLRGSTKVVRSNTTGAENTESTAVTSFNSNGFSLGDNNEVNYQNDAFVAWSWKANGAGVTNTAGSTTSTVSANTTSGFSIVTYTGNGNASATIGHGLGVAPSMFIIKCRNNLTGATIWPIYHKSIGNTDYLDLSSINTSATLTIAWNNTSPTSSVFTVGSADGVNGNGNTFVAYCFAPIFGFSEFGSYTGNGSADGPFVYTGFRPRFVMVKQATVSARDWIILDTSRNTYNVADLQLMPNKSDAEATTVLSSTAYLDILSNGFKVRNTSVRNNENTATYIYAAFAENPFKNALAR